MRKYLCHFLTFIPVVAALTGCGLVDEDLGDCETEYKLAQTIAGFLGRQMES